jgi:hypothetical protein
MNPDILAACIAALRAVPAMVATFGDAPPAEPHFWSDYAGPSVPALPYAIFTEAADQEGFETIDPSDEVWSVVGGIVSCQVFASGKTLARRLADQVSAFLTDAPLSFAGIPSTGNGTVAATNGDATLTFSRAPTDISGLYLAVAGDTSPGPMFGGLYLVTGGSSASWTIAPPFAGATLAAAPWSVAQQAGLIYFRRMGRSFPILTDIGPDRSPTIYGRAVQFKYRYEQMDEVL